ncbi:MAG: GerMN domain-containing protein [Acidobacteriaceae bacterium]
MISRWQKFLFAAMLLACVAMAAFLLRLRNRAQDRLQAQGALAPTDLNEAAGNPVKTVTLYVPNDLDDALTAVEKSIPMPQDENAEAQVLLENLMDAFRAPGSTHPIGLGAGAGIDEVYFLPLPQPKGAAESAGQLAVVDLSGALAAAEPSGIEPETLTLESILATLHANLPDVTQVHFLVDGQPRETLAGHADLTRTYLATDPPIAPAETGR